MNDEAKTKPKKPLWMRILVPVATLLVMLILVELFLQIFAPLPFSDKLYWLADGHVKARLEPHQDVTNAGGNPVRINHLGYRGADWTWEPAPGTLRLLVLGGSAAFCFQVSSDERVWTAVLERELSRRLGSDVEVLNLGLPGYDTSNSKVNYLFSGRALHPHAVLVYHTWNDMKFLRAIDESDGPPRALLSGRPSTGTNPSALERVFRRLQIVRRIDRALTRVAQRDRENRYTSLEQAGERAHQPASDRAWSWFRSNFDDIASFIRGDDRLPVLISQASLVHPDTIDQREHRLVISNDFQGMTLPRLADSWLEASRIIEEVARERDAVFVDGYGAVPHDLRHLGDHVHLTDEGSERLARAIADTLLADPRFTALAAAVRGGGRAQAD
jgi:hypothetical protein